MHGQPRPLLAPWGSWDCELLLAEERLQVSHLRLEGLSAAAFPAAAKVQEISLAVGGTQRDCRVSERRCST